MNKLHQYALEVHWTGNTGNGTSDYRGYERSHSIEVDGKPVIEGSSDVAFRGDNTRHSPEELFVSSIAACHMLWYLHLCSDAGVRVIAYTDQATATMAETDDGGGRFVEVVLHPRVLVSESAMLSRARELHHRAHQLCFIANSCNFPIRHEASISADSTP